MAGFALLFGEGIVHELLQQLGTIGLVRIMAFKTVSFTERLIPVRIDETAVFRVVTIKTKSRNRFRQMEQAVGILAVFMAHMAAVTSQVEGCMAASFF